MATGDVTVMGAGVFGLTIALACVRRGARVQVIDPRGPGGGASGGIVGALAPHTPERWDATKAFQLENLLDAQRYWDGVDAASGQSSGYFRMGRLQAINDAHNLKLAHERVSQAHEYWRGMAEWQVRPSADFADWAPTSEMGHLVYDTLSARIDPLSACQSLAAALRNQGVKVVDDSETNGQVVWATGYEGILELVKETDGPVGNGVKGQAALLDFDARDEPQIFADALHVVPHSNGTVAVGSTSERYFSSPTETDEQLDQMIERARRVVPQLENAAVISKWAGVRPRSKTRGPMLGAYPDRSGHFVANGGFKIGFAIAPKIAEIMAELVLEGRDTIPDTFRIETCL